MRSHSLFFGPSLLLLLYSKRKQEEGEDQSAVRAVIINGGAALCALWPDLVQTPPMLKLLFMTNTPSPAHF